MLRQGVEVAGSECASLHTHPRPPLITIHSGTILDFGEYPSDVQQPLNPSAINDNAVSGNQKLFHRSTKEPGYLARILLLLFVFVRDARWISRLVTNQSHTRASLLIDMVVDDQGNGASGNVVPECDVFLHMLSRRPKSTNLTSLIHRQSIPLSAVTVFSPSDRFKMVRVDAVHMAAATIPNVIDIHPLGNGSDKTDIEEAMCANLPPVKRSDRIARGISRSLPKPAIRLRINDVVNQGYGVLCALMAGDIPHGKPHNPSLLGIALLRNRGWLTAPTHAQARRIGWRHRCAKGDVSGLSRTGGASTFIGQDTAIGTGNGWKGLSRAIVETCHLLTSYIGREVRRARSVDALPGFSLPEFYHKGVL